jgi:hypothetical protein
VKEKITKLGSWGLYENIVQFTSATVVLAGTSAILPPRLSATSAIYRRNNVQLEGTKPSPCLDSRLFCSMPLALWGTVSFRHPSAIHPPLPVKKADECATINVL